MISNFFHIWGNLWVRWVLRLAFSAFVLGLIFTQIDFISVVETLSLVDVRLLGAVFALFFGIRLIWAYQMSLGLKSVRMRCTVVDLLKINLISSFYGFVLPGNLIPGGAAAWYKLSRLTGQGLESLAWLISFRLVNMLMLLGIGLVGICFDPHLASFRFRVVIGVMFGGVVLLSLPILSQAGVSFIEGVCRPLFHRLPIPHWVQAKGARLWQTVIMFQALNKRTIATILSLSLLAHIVRIINFYLLALAINVHVPLFVICWIRSLLDIIVIIPISIGGLGIREVSLVLLLRDYGILESQALSLSLALFSVMVVGGIVGGLLEGWDVLRGGKQRPSPTVSEREVSTATYIPTSKTLKEKHRVLHRGDQ